MLGALTAREFIKISERPGVSGQLGEALVKQQEKLFSVWHRVRDGTLERCDFLESAHQIRQQLLALLQQGADGCNAILWGERLGDMKAQKK